MERHASGGSQTAKNDPSYKAFINQQFMEHYVFDFLEPESLTHIGTIDLCEVDEIYTDEKFRKLVDLENSELLQKNIFFIEADNVMD